MTYQRKCDNWLLSFKDWIAPRAESPESYIFWSGVFTLSSALRRKVFIGKKYLGGWTCYPHFYVMFVGPPGLRKTTTMEFCIDLLDNISELNNPPTLVTKESLIDSLIKAQDSALYLTIEEFSDLIMKGGKEMYELLTSLFDAKKSISVGTMMRGFEGTERPCLNMIAATTPEWITYNMPAAAIGGGFASRVIFVYENKVRQRRLFHDEIMQNNNFEIQEAALVADLDHIAKNITGEFELTKEARDYAEQWYLDTADTVQMKKLQGYYQRKPTHLLKLSQIVRVSYTDELVIEKSDIETALGILGLIEGNLRQVFAGVGKNTYALEMKDIADYLNEVKHVPERKFREHFESAAEPGKLSELIEGLQLMGKVRRETSEEDGFILVWNG